MEPIQKGKQTNKTSNTCTSDKGKQTNKQVEAAHAEVQMQGVVQSCITCGVRYAMHQSMQKSFRDASEKCRVRYTGSYSDSDKISVDFSLREDVTAGDGLCHMSHLSRLHDGF